MKNKMKTTYIAGPMSGIEGFNKPAFDAAAKRLRKQRKIVINPAENFGGDQTLEHSDYMRYCIHQLLICSEIYMLKGWMQSKGAQAENIIAQSLGLEVHFE